MRTEDRIKLRSALMDLSSRRYGHSDADRVELLENVVALITEILVRESDSRPDSAFGGGTGTQRKTS
jgi:hypothetical protein